ncbi:MAG: hypothetical protein ABIC95_05800 [archaeon]
MAISSPRTILIITIVLLISLALSGCTGQGGRDDDVSSISTDFHKGTEGLRLQFVEKAPPPVIYDTPGTGGLGNPEIVVVAEVHNRGAVDTDAYIYLGGFDNTIIGLPNEYEENPLPLIGRSIYNADGELRIIQFPTSNGADIAGGYIQLPPNTDRYQPKLQMTACYDYWTEASPIVCVALNPYRITNKQACRPGTVRGTFGGQGAPVAITGVKAEVIPGEVIFKIGISNSGKGRVIDYLTTQGSGFSGYQCPYNLDYMNLNNVEYEVIFQRNIITSQNTDPGSSMHCQPDKVKLSNGKGLLYCRFPLDPTQESAYETTVEINLHYGYMDTIYKQLDIRAIGKDAGH